MTGQWVRLDGDDNTSYAVVTIENKPGEYLCPNYFGDCSPITTKQAGPNHDRAEIDLDETKKVKADTGRELTFRMGHVPGAGNTDQPTGRQSIVGGPVDGPTVPVAPGQEGALEVGYANRQKREQATNRVKQALRALVGRGNLNLKISVDSEGRLTLKSVERNSRWLNTETSATEIPENEIKRLLASLSFPAELRGSPVITFTVNFTKLTQ